MRFVLLFALAGCSEYAVYDHTDPVDPPLDEYEDELVEDEDVTPIADAPVYANTSTDLWEVDPETGAKTHHGTFHDVGGAPVEGMVDIAIDLTGRMYGGNFEALYRIDPTNGLAIKVCDTDLRPYALAFTSDGVLFAGAGTEVVSIDLASCMATPLANSGGYETSGDLVGLPDGYLYWTVEGYDSDELVRVDPDSGASTWIGTIPATDLFGLGYDEGQLYGFSKGGEIVRISPVGASSTITVSDPGISWWGATTNPVVWQ